MVDGRSVSESNPALQSAIEAELILFGDCNTEGQGENDPYFAGDNRSKYQTLRATIALT